LEIKTLPSREDGVTYMGRWRGLTPVANLFGLIHWIGWANHGLKLAKYTVSHFCLLLRIFHYLTS
jgi:hypothetical protein